MIPSAANDGPAATLARAVPVGARRIAVAGSYDEPLATALTAARPDRQLTWAGPGPGTDPLCAEDGTPDAVVYPTGLPALSHAEQVLSRHRRSLAPGGVAVGLVPNPRHHAALLALLRGELPAGLGGFQAGHAWSHTLAAAQRLFLDAGLAPDLAGVVSDPTPADVLAALGPALARAGAAGRRDRFELDAAAFVLWAHPVAGADDPPADLMPLTVVACVTDDAVLRANLLASPDRGPGSSHEVLLVRNCRSAADGMNLGLDRARNAVVVAAHQDVYLPRGWAARFARQWRLAERVVGRVGVAGAYGIVGRWVEARRAGHVVDRIRLLRETTSLPAAADSLDELLLAVRRDAGLRFDPVLGFHLYGTDVCLAAARQGLAAAVLDVPCLHNSRGEGLPVGFAASVAALAAKWEGELPVATPCVRVERTGGYSEW